MPSQPAIPPALSNQFPCLPPAGSLTLITSVLGASANWIVQRHISAALKPQPLASVKEGTDVEIVLISWLRGSEFWGEALKKLGLGFATDERITFFDALRSGLGLQGSLVEVEEVLCASIDGSKAVGTRVLLILDGLDFLLAATEANVEDVLDMTGELREHVHATIVSATADYPLIQAHRTPVEINHAALMMGIAHQARTIWGVRELDTGSARDVTGVLRITRGATSEEDTAPEGGENVEETELLYFIQGDGGARVFERGS
ncbi:MAG: hypothetical protein Q9210_001302 [Variospora velana]